MEKKKKRKTEDKGEEEPTLNTEQLKERWIMLCRQAWQDKFYLTLLIIVIYIMAFVLMNTSTYIQDCNEFWKDQFTEHCQNYDYQSLIKTNWSIQNGNENTDQNTQRPRKYD